MGNQGLHVEPIPVEDGPVRVVHREDAGAHCAEDLRRVAAHVAKALEDDRLAFHRLALVGEEVFDAVGHALPGRLHPAFTAADADVLAGDHAAIGVPLALAVEVLTEHQRHHFPVGPHVGRGDVDVGTDEALQLEHEAEGDVLELLPAVLTRVDLNSALAAAKGHLGDGRLPRHLRGERLEEVQRHFAVVPDATLVRPARLVVLDPVGLEPLRLPGDELIDASVGKAKVAPADVHIRAQERLPVQNHLALREPLEPLWIANRGDLEVRELPRGLLGDGDQAVLELCRDVEDVLVVRLLEFEADAPVEADHVGGAVEHLHRVRVESALGRRVGDAHEGFLVRHDDDSGVAVAAGRPAGKVLGAVRGCRAV